MFLSFWAPSRLSFSLINNRPPQSNRCYSSNPSKFVSPEPRLSRLFHILTVCLQRNNPSMNSAHGKQVPLFMALQPPRHEDNPVIVSPQVPRLHWGGTFKTVTPSLTALSAFWSISSFFFLFFLSFHLHCICGLTPQSLLLYFITSSKLQTIPPLTSRHLPTLTLLQLKSLYSMETIVEGGGKYICMLFSVKAENQLLGKCFSL